jgi:hypothetical protein
MHGGLFVPNQHMLDRLLLVKRVVDVEHGAARIAPKVLDPFGLQTSDEDLRAVGLACRGMRRRALG